MKTFWRRMRCLALAGLAGILSPGCRADPRVDSFYCGERMIVVTDASIVRGPDGMLFASARSTCVPSLLVPGLCGVEVELRRLGEALGQYYLPDDGANGDEVAGDGLYSGLLPDDGGPDEALFWEGPCPAPPVSVAIE